MKYVAPKRGVKAFTCPFCGVLTRQYHRSSLPELDANYQYNPDHPIAAITCEHCNKFSLWFKNTIVFPNRGAAPHPNPDMPEDVRKDYEEATRICNRSPRGAAALLRLSIQKLCVFLGGKGENINDDISVLVTKGLPGTIQQALDVVRVIGNNAVHPGQIDVDDAGVVSNLFSLVNVICEYMISMPEKISGLYGSLPEASREAIKKRDEKR
jgi:hypothetical protein